MPDARSETRGRIMTGRVKKHGAEPPFGRSEAPNAIQDSLDQLSQGISVIDSELKLILFNRKFAELLEFPQEMVRIGTPLEAFFRYNAERGEYGPGDIDGLVGERMELAKKREPHVFERTRPDGMTLEIVGNPLPDGGFVTTYTDITEKKAAERKLRQQAELLSKLLDHSPSIIAVRDVEGRYQLINKAYEEAFGISDAEVKGKTPSEIIPGGFSEDLSVYDRQVIETGRPMVHQHAATLPRGGDMLLSVRFPIRNEAGAVVAVGSFGTDITALKAAEDRFRKAFDSSPSLVSITDTETGAYIDVNQTWLRVMGFSRDEVIGKTTGELEILVDDSHRVNVIRYLRKHGRMRDMQSKLVTKTGALRDVVVFADLIEIEGTERLFTVSHDVTDRKAAELALQEREALLDSIFENVPVALLIKNADHVVERPNRTYLEWYGLDAQSMIGRRSDEIEEFQSPEEAALMNKQEQEVLATGKALKRQVSRPFADGSTHVIEITKFPVYARDGRITQVGSVSIDLTEQIEVRREAQRASRAKSAFLATMSHEFRTPLNAILGFSEMLRSEFFGPLGVATYVEYADDIHNSGRQMLSLVNDVLDISAIEAGKRVINKEQIDIRHLIDQCARNLERRAAEGGVGVSLHFADGLPTLVADQRSVAQVVQNLLHNAIKFTGDGGSVEVFAYGADKRICIAIKDTGIGIEDDKIATVTEPFAQTHTNPHMAQEGTGLGLTIVKSLVEAHGGELTIESEYGRGTTVVAAFPIGARS